jgi:hypothetical protein
MIHGLTGNFVVATQAWNRIYQFRKVPTLFFDYVVIWSDANIGST